jgi:hypothetical protein
MRAAFSYVFAAAILLSPIPALAQAILTGTVRDASGSVMPGVTVEASSDALIEKRRSAVTDDTGQWRIIDLRPGLYSVRFTLVGFTTIVQDGIEVTGSATVNVPAEMKIGQLQESVTVTADTPVVDAQNAKREIVLQGEFVNSLPATRNYSAILSTIPAITVGIVTSAEVVPEMQFFSARGGPATEGRMMVDGMPVAMPFSGSGTSSFTYDTGNAVEITVNLSGGLGEMETGGVSMNLIPRSGGNRFAGNAFFSAAGDWSRSENIDDELRSIGITRAPALRGAYDGNISYGGPIKRDRLWFYGTYRQFTSARVVEGASGPNAFAGDSTKWVWQSDGSNTEVRTALAKDIYSGRLTAAVGRSRVSFSQENQYRCDGSSLTTTGEGCRQPTGDWIALGGATTSPEAANGAFGGGAGYLANPYYVTQATWNMPHTSRLLFDAGVSRLSYMPTVTGQLPPGGIFDQIPVTEVVARDGHRANFSYRAVNTYRDDWAQANQFRGAASYVTGSHNVKVGYQGAFHLSDTTTRTNSTLMAYQFNTTATATPEDQAIGVPSQFTIRLPNWQTADRTMSHSVYAQDSWTRKRLTVQGAIRYDRAYSWSPESHNGTADTSRWNAAPLTFPRTISVSGYNDITTRWGAAYDLFGNGRTAIKVNVGKYLDATTNDGNFTVNNPANRIQQTMTRNWVDRDKDKVVDCDILNVAAQSPTLTGSVDDCAQPGGNSLRFANALTGLTQVNPEILSGWGTRPYNGQFGLAWQQQVLPRVSMEVAYNRRWFGNFTVTDNRALGASDFETWIATAPTDPRLPNDGGYQVTGMLVKPESNGRPAQNYVTFERDFGEERTNYWHGVEVTANARMRNGFTFQGGTSTGREVDDQCAVRPNYTRPVPPFNTTFTRDLRNCKTVEPFRTSFRGSATYTVPKVDVLISGIARLSPAPEITATYNVPNTVIQAQLGHLPAGGTTTGFQAINLLDTNQMYAERRQYQVDMRFAKVLRFGGRRADIGIDLYNIFNVNTPTGYDGTYDYTPAAGLGPGGEWLRPTSIVQPRFARFNVTVNF